MNVSHANSGSAVFLFRQLTSIWVDAGQDNNSGLIYELKTEGASEVQINLHVLTFKGLFCLFSIKLTWLEIISLINKVSFYSNFLW